LGIKADDSDNTMVQISNGAKVEGNVWKMTTAAKAKYTGNIGRMFISSVEGFTQNNITDVDYSYSRVYDGGERRTTANLPYLVEFDDINDGADCFDLTTGTMKYWFNNQWN